MTVCVPKGDTWWFELVPARNLECVEIHQRMGLRACPSAWVRVYRGQQETALEVANDILQHWRALLAAWWGVIALTRGQVALDEAKKYASTRYQGGAVLVEHALVQEMLARAQAGLMAAEVLLERGFSGDSTSLTMGARWAARAGEEAARMAQQIFGGYGYMRDYPVERCVRDAKTAAAAGGVLVRYRPTTAEIAATPESMASSEREEVFGQGGSRCARE